MTTTTQDKRTAFKPPAEPDRTPREDLRVFDAQARLWTLGASAWALVMTLANVAFWSSSHQRWALVVAVMWAATAPVYPLSYGIFSAARRWSLKRWARRHGIELGR